MKKWIKIGACCEARGAAKARIGVTYQIVSVYGFSELDIFILPYNDDGDGFWISNKNLLRTNKARKDEKKLKQEIAETQKKDDLAKARFLADKHGYVVVRRMP